MNKQKIAKEMYERCMRNVMCASSFKEFSIKNVIYIEKRNKKQKNPVRQISDMIINVKELLEIR